MSCVDMLRVNRELLLNFFLHFARVEYALKTAGYFNGDERKVRADWMCFASSLEPNFDKYASPGLGKACDLFFINSPRKQVVQGGQLMWRTQGRDPEQSEIAFLLEMVRSVRNNLFHGGKYNIDVHEDPQRTELLLRSSLTILEECVRLSPDVKAAYDEAKL